MKTSLIQNFKKNRARELYNIYNGTVINLKFAAVILAGGKSRRMGKNKAWLPLGGRRVSDRPHGNALRGSAPISEDAARCRPRRG